MSNIWVKSTFTWNFSLHFFDLAPECFGSESLVVESGVSNPENRNKHQAQNETKELLKTNVPRF